MNKLPQRPGARAFSVALASLGCSLGVVLPANAMEPPPLDKPLSAETIKLLAQQHKLSTDQIKRIQAGNDRFNAIFIKYEAAAREAGSGMATGRRESPSKASTGKSLEAVQQKVERARAELQAIFIKIDSIGAKHEKMDAVQGKHIDAANLKGGHIKGEKAQ